MPAKGHLPSVECSDAVLDDEPDWLGVAETARTLVHLQPSLVDSFSSWPGSVPGPDLVSASEQDFRLRRRLLPQECPQHHLWLILVKLDGIVSPHTSKVVTPRTMGMVKVGPRIHQDGNSAMVQRNG
jgi:hypothetical protein